MKVEGIQPGEEVSVTVSLLKVLEVEKGAYCLKVLAACILKSSEDIFRRNDIQCSLRVEVNTQEKVTWVSKPTHF